MMQEHGTCDTQAMTARLGSVGGEIATGWQRVQKMGRNGRNRWAERRNTHIQRLRLPEHLPVPRPGQSPACLRFTIPPLQGSSDEWPLPLLSPWSLRTAAITDGQ